MAKPLLAPARQVRQGTDGDRKRTPEPPASQCSQSQVTGYAQFVTTCSSPETYSADDAGRLILTCRLEGKAERILLEDRQGVATAYKAATGCAPVVVITSLPETNIAGVALRRGQPGRQVAPQIGREGHRMAMQCRGHGRRTLEIGFAPPAAIWCLPGMPIAGGAIHPIRMRRQGQLLRQRKVRASAKPRASRKGGAKAAWPQVVVTEVLGAVLASGTGQLQQ